MPTMEFRVILMVVTSSLSRYEAKPKFFAVFLKQRAEIPKNSTTNFN
jgi:hypothetical protein